MHVILKESSTEESPLVREICRTDSLTEILHCVQNDVHTTTKNNTKALNKYRRIYQGFCYISVWVNMSQSVRCHLVPYLPSYHHLHRRRQKQGLRQ